MSRLLVVCPGRGSYSKETLGSLRKTPSVVAADAFRARLGRPTPTEMDAVEAMSSRLHVAGENASILTMAASLADHDALDPSHVVAVVGNSMGWYTALAVAGALPLESAFHLVETMGQYQVDNVIGGQLLYPLVDEDWRELRSLELAAALDDTSELYHSIHLGGQAVVGGSVAAINALSKRLSVRKIGVRDAPMLLPLHSAFHTPLMADTSKRAFTDLGNLPFQAPRVPLVDGRGVVFHPRTAEPGAIRDYTLGHQVTHPYDFTTSLVVALRDFAPDRIVLLGPGGNLGGPVAQTLIREGWKQFTGRTNFVERQSVDPFVIAMNRPEQRQLVTDV